MRRWHPGANSSMWRPRLTNPWRRLRRRCTALLAALAYLAGTIGFPLPAPSAKAQNQPVAATPRCAACGTPVGRPCCCQAPIADLSAPRVPSCCRSETVNDAPPQKPGCCAHSEDHTDSAQPVKPPSAPRWVLGTPKCACDGGSHTWLSAGVESLPPPRMTWSLSTAVRPSRPPADLFAAMLPTLPPDPPPRSLST
jgi:hypothetical protein